MGVSFSREGRRFAAGITIDRARPARRRMGREQCHPAFRSGLRLCEPLLQHPCRRGPGDRCRSVVSATKGLSDLQRNVANAAHIAVLR